MMTSRPVLFFDHIQHVKYWRTTSDCMYWEFRGATEVFTATVLLQSQGQSHQAEPRGMRPGNLMFHIVENDGFDAPCSTMLNSQPSGGVISGRVY